MTTTPRQLDLVFIWHMHQPDYRDLSERRILMPWVRLHALKDYYDMAARLQRYENVHQTFNLVPSLLEQIECYQDSEWKEDELELFSRPAEELTEQEKRLILGSFFMATEKNLIRPYPRYAALYRDYLLHNTELIRTWSPQEWRDLQFWRQLSWIDPMVREEDEGFNSLIRQGQFFREDQKAPLLATMRKWLRGIIPLYRDMQQQGLLEISVTPYYHPILPLLIQPESVLEAMPDCPLPDPCGAHPEDARFHMEKALEYYQDRFGQKARGVWPSEGSVSQAVVELFNDLSVRWCATDEEILARSLGKAIRDHHSGDAPAHAELYKIYQTLSGQGPHIVFRDHHLSDLIGFEYSQWDPDKAVDHFIGRLEGVLKTWQGDQNPVVTVILDGENCWEYYQADGSVFLEGLYTRLSQHPDIRCLTVSEAIAEHTAAPLEKVSAGSWINGNFYIWMGEEADRRGWALLEKARQALIKAEQENRLTDEQKTEAWKEIHIAQGSDWYWWFGDSQHSDQDELFDEMFRTHLMRVYETIGVSIPPDLLVPVEIPKSGSSVCTDRQLPAQPIVDGRESHYYEWRAAATIAPEQQGGTMRSNRKSAIKKIHFGTDAKHLYLRIDPEQPLRKPGGDWRWELRINQPNQLTFRFVPTSEGYQVLRIRTTNEETIQEDITGPEAQAAEQTIFEAALSWDLLEIEQNATCSFFVAYGAGGAEKELIPRISSLCVYVPRAGKRPVQWFV